MSDTKTPTDLQQPEICRAGIARKSLRTQNITRPVTLAPQPRRNSIHRKWTKINSLGHRRQSCPIEDEILYPENTIPDLDAEAAAAVDNIWKAIQQYVQTPVEPENPSGISRSIVGIMKEVRFWESFGETLNQRNISICDTTLGNTKRKPHEHFGEKPLPGNKVRGSAFRSTPLNTLQNPRLVESLDLWVNVEDVGKIIRAFKKLIQSNAVEAEYSVRMIEFFLKDDDPTDERCRAVARKVQSPIAREQNRPGSVLSPPLSSHEGVSKRDNSDDVLQNGDPDDCGLYYAREAAAEVTPETIVVSPQEASEYWNIAPDLVYRLTLRGFNPEYRCSSLNGIAHSRRDESERASTPLTNEDAPTIGYFSIEFKRDFKQASEAARAKTKAEFQMTAAGVLWLSWAYRYRVRALEILEQPVNQDNYETLFQHVKHYGMTVRGSAYEVWIFAPKFGGPASLRWGGCDVRKLAEGNLLTEEGVLAMADWVNEIHWWALTEFHTQFENDCKLIAEKESGPGQYSAQKPFHERYIALPDLDAGDLGLGTLSLDPDQLVTVKK